MYTVTVRFYKTSDRKWYTTEERHVPENLLKSVLYKYATDDDYYIDKLSVEREILVPEDI